MGSGWKVRVAVIDDHPLFRKGLIELLRAEPELEVVGEAGSAEEARTLIASRETDLAIVDVLMPAISGITLAAEIHELAPGCLILALSVIDEPCLIADMLRAGASGFAVKTQTSDEILDAIYQVMAGARYLPPRVSSTAVEAELSAPSNTAMALLTRREREIFELVIRGFSTCEIAARLFIAVRTVETHRQRICKKLATRSIAELQRLAARYGGI